MTEIQRATLYESKIFNKWRNERYGYGNVEKTDKWEVDIDLF